MFSNPRSRRLTTVVAGASIVALALSACSSDGDAEGSSTNADGKIELTIATFNNFGYTDELLAEYTAANPDVVIKHTKAAKTEDARSNLTTKLAAGGDGLADIEGIEVDWMPELDMISTAFADLSDPSVDGRYIDWKLAQGTASDGTLIGLGTDIGPAGICYRSDLFEAAGLPTDRAEVAELLGGEDATWDEYFEVGQQFAATSDSAWYDSSMSIMQGMVGQVDAAYEDPTTGEPTDLASNTEVKAAYDSINAVAPELSAHLEQWSPDWDAAFQNSGFATMLCPAWMTGPIEERSGGVTGWDVADVFPGGGGNWGGSFLTVPKGGKNVEEAKKLALWLTAPEQQIKAFDNAGTFPSQVEAYEDETLTSATNEFFNAAPVGEIYTNRSKAVNPVPPYKGQNYFAIHQAVQDAIKRVDVEQTQQPDEAWTQAVSDFSNLGF